jgi:hypothetical protein
MNNKQLEERICKLEQLYERIEQKLDQILEIIDTKISKSCNKMSSHIDFVENVYDNVKNPLGFICNRVSKLIGSDEQYTLENQEGSIEEQEEEFGLED